MSKSHDNERRYYDALKQITRYQTTERLRRHSWNDWGLPYEDALEMAYQNVIDEAKRAIKGKRRAAGATLSRRAPASQKDFHDAE